MGPEITTVEKNAVVLLRLGVGRKEFVLPEGATLSSLLREAGVDAEGTEITIDGLTLAESLVLRPGTIVTVVPGSKSPNREPPWLAASGMFRDNPDFDELMKRVEEARKAERERDQ